MALREFTDSQGVFWRAWDVVPTLGEALEQRRYDRRNPDPVLLYTGSERRAGAERRRMASGKVAPLREWLAFESETEKRRLAPIPRGWCELSDEELEILCAGAANVPKLTSF